MREENKKMQVITDEDFLKLSAAFLSEKPLDRALSIGRHHPAMILRTHEFILRHRSTMALERIATALEKK